MGKGSFLVILAFKTANRTVNTDVIFQVLFYIIGGVSKSMLKKSRLNFDKIEKCK